MNRRAEAGEEESIKQAVFAVFAILAILVLVTIIASLMRLWYPDRELNFAAQNNLENLAYDIKTNGNYPEKMLVYVPSTMFIVAFEKDEPRAYIGGCHNPSVTGVSDLHVQRPDECPRGTCLCLCRKADSCRAEAECIRLKQDYSFRTDTCDAGAILGSQGSQVMTLRKAGNEVTFCVKDCSA